LYNYHGADLPTERGAGCITWRILLNKEKYNNLNIHKVDKTFDTGEVVFKIKNKKNFKNPRPIDIYKHQIKLESLFLVNFLKKLLNKRNIFKIEKQNSNNSYYWPKLNSDVDGKINWDWDARDIASFIRGFSHPFNGAFSYIGKYKVKVFNASFHRSKTRFHPFQNGLIFRMDKKNIYVAATSYFIKIPINEIISDINKKEFLIGKRFK
jgi:methionyl-tRNA formyltransferase